MEKARLSTVRADGERGMAAFISRTLVRSSCLAAARRSSSASATKRNSDSQPSSIKAKVQARLMSSATSLGTLTQAFISTPLQQSMAGAPTDPSSGISDNSGTSAAPQPKRPKTATLPARQMQQTTQLVTSNLVSNRHHSSNCGILDYECVSAM